MKELRPHELEPRGPELHAADPAYALAWDSTQPDEENVEDRPAPGMRSRVAEVYAFGARPQRRGPRKPGGSNYAARIYDGVRVKQQQATAAAIAAAVPGVSGVVLESGVARAIEQIDPAQVLALIDDSRGEPLSPAQQSYFRARIGIRVDDVQIHADDAAAAAAAALGARAFVAGRRIFLATGEHHPGAATSDRLLAEALAVIARDERRAAIAEAEAGVRLAASPDGGAAAVAPGAEAELARLARGGGAPLPDDVRGRMEPLFGHDFSHVRVHADGEAASAAASVNARAFTIGSDLYFGFGAFAPESEAGNRLLVHELTHVVQHDQGRLPGSSGGGIEVSAPSDATEREAVAMEGRAAEARGGTGASTGNAAGPSAGATAAREPTAAPPPRSAHASNPGYRASRDLLGDIKDWGADKVDDIKEWGADRIRSVVAKVAPGLITLMEQGPGALLKQAIEPAIRSFVGGVTGGIKASPFGDVAKQFSSVFALLQGARAGDPKCCETLVNGINAFRETAMAFIHNPAFEAIKSVLGTISDAFAKITKLVIAPVFDVVKDVVGGAWDAVKGVASTIWGWIKAAKDVAGKVFDWVAQQLGFSGVSGEGGIVDWLKGKISDIWTSIREMIQPIAGPLKVIGGVLIALSPIGPIVAIVKFGPQIVEAVQWLWANRSNPNIVKDAHKQMGHTILPKILDVGSTLVGHLKSAASWLAETATSLASSVLQLLGAISGIPLLSMAQGFVQGLQEGVKSLQTWAQQAFHDAADWVGDIYKKTADFIRPYKEVLCSIGTCIVNPAGIPFVLAGWAWKWLPDCIKPPIIDLFLDIVLEVIGGMPSLPMFGALWPMLKPAVMGFLRGVRAQPPEAKIKVTNKLAKIISGSSPEFLWGFVKGFLRGIWDNVKMPFEIIWGLATGLTKVVDYFGHLADEAAKPVHPEPTPGATPSGSPGSPSAPRPAPPPPPGSLTWDTMYGQVSQYAAGLWATNPPNPRPAAPGAATRPSGEPGKAAAPDLAAEARRIGEDLAEPIGKVKTGFWPAVKAVFGTETIKSLPDLMGKLGAIWDAAKHGIGSMAFELATKIFHFFMGDGAEDKLGDTIGYIVGMVAFQAVLDFFTVGAGAAIPVLSQIAKFLNWPMKALDEVMRLVKFLGGHVLTAVKSLGNIIGKAGGPVRIVIDAFREIGEKLIAHADDLLAKFGGRAGKTEARTAEGEAARTAEGQAGRKAEGEAADEASAAAKAERTAAEKEAMKAEELAEVHLIVQSILRSAQVTGIKAQIVVASLDTLKVRYVWIKRFEMRSIGVHIYEVYLIASEFLEGVHEDRRDPENPLDGPPARSSTWHLEVDPPKCEFRTARQWDELIEGAANDQEAYMLRRQRYRQSCEPPSDKTEMPLADWEAQTKRLHENAAKGRAAEQEALAETGIANNNTVDTALEGRIRRWPDPPKEGEVSCRPDGVSDRHWVDVKATSEDRVYMTEQLRLELQGAEAEGKGLAVIIVSDNPAVQPSGPLADKAASVLLKREGQWFEWSKRTDKWKPMPSGPAGTL